MTSAFLAAGVVLPRYAPSDLIPQVNLLTFNEPMLTQHASDALYALFRASEPPLPASAILPLLKVLDELPLEEADSGAAGSMSRLLRAAYTRLYQADAKAGRAALPRAFLTLSRLLSNGGEGAAMVRGQGATSSCTVQLP